MLKTGTPAPDFTLYATPDQRLRLSEFKGKKVILAFYPADWSPVCDDQMSLYNEMLELFGKYNAIPMGISVDGRWCHHAFSGDRKLHFPLLSDFEPKGAVASMYDVYDRTEGECKRALYIVDEEGIIRWSYLSPVGINPGADGIFLALEEMQQDADEEREATGLLRPPVSVSEYYQGPADAVIELVEYGDYQCPHCGRAYPLVKMIQEKFGDDIKFIFRNFPLSKIHPQAKMAAAAAEAAGLQGKFWDMHDIIFENQQRLHRNAILEYADMVGLNLEQFKADLESPAIVEKVKSDLESGFRSGVNRTPTFFINGKKYNGDWEEDMEEYLKTKILIL